MMNVLVLLSVTKDDGKHKPAISKCYNYTKRRADIIDQKMGNYTVKPKSSRLTIAAFSCILDAAHVNAATLSRSNQKKFAKTRSTNAFMYDGSWPYPWFNHSWIIVTSFQMVCINAIAELFGVKIERPATPPGERKHRGTCLEQIEAVDQKK